MGKALTGKVLTGKVKLERVELLPDDACSNAFGAGGLQGMWSIFTLDAVENGFAHGTFPLGLQEWAVKGYPMFGKLKKIFDKEQKPQFTDGQYERHYELKKQGLEKILGEMYDLVGHAIVPFQVGGAVDMYYFPQCY